MKPKVWTLVIVVVVLLAVGLKLFVFPQGDGGAGPVDWAGEVALTNPRADDSQTLQPEHVLPDFFMTSPDGSIQTLSSMKGKHIFINFWDIGCHPCREEMPDLNRLYEEYKNQNVVFIFIHAVIQDMQLQELGQFVRKHGYTLPVYLDRNGDIFASYGVRGIPTTVVVSPQGELVYASPGQIDYNMARSLITGAD